MIDRDKIEEILENYEICWIGETEEMFIKERKCLILTEEGVILQDI